MIKVFSISTKSVLVDFKKIKIQLIGFSITRVEFHGISDRTLLPLWQILTHKFELVSFRVTNSAVIITLGIISDELKISRLSNPEKLIRDQLPPDCEITRLSGYDLPIAHVLGAENLDHQYLLFRDLQFNSNSLSLLRGILGFIGTTIVLGNYSYDESISCSLLIETSISDTDVVQQLYSFLKNIPDCSGELELLSQRYIGKNPGLCALGISKHSMKEEILNAILSDLVKILSISSNPIAPSIEPPLIMNFPRRNISDAVRMEQMEPLSQTKLEELKVILTPHLTQNGWLIVEEELLTDHQCRLTIINEAVELMIYLIDEFSTYPQSLTKTEIRDDNLPIILSHQPIPLSWKNEIPANYYNVDDLQHYSTFSLFA